MRMLRQAGSFSDGSIMPPLPKRPDWTCGRERSSFSATRKAGTLAMTKSATLAIDLPMKALVWQDDQDRVWLTYNTSEYNAKYVLPRHGLSASDDAWKALENFLTDVTDRSTQYCSASRLN